MITRTLQGTSLAESDGVTDTIELLRGILAKEQQRPVGYGEAQEVGASLIEFYQILAEEVEDEPAD